MCLLVICSMFCAESIAGEAQISASLETADAQVLLDRAKNKKHPRGIDLSALRAKDIADVAVGKLLRQEIGQWRMEPLPAEPVTGPGSPNGGLAIQKSVFDEEDKVLPAALAWLATGDRQALDEAKRRALNLAGWDPQGTTGFPSHDQAGLSISWTLALAYDWLYPELSEAERTRLAAVVSARLRDIMGKGPYGLDDGRKLDANPYDSHGAVALARVAAICTVMAGVAPEFDACFRNTVLRYLKRPVPWGGDDGGYANGTTYGQWDTAFTHLIVWDVLHHGIGVDLTQAPWAQGYGSFIAYFLPLGTPTGMFGDGAERNWRGVWATQARAYAARVPSPLADWYARQQFGEDESSLQRLLAPYRDWDSIPAQIPAGTPNAIQMPSIGWVAMHSNLADPGRTSVYFKSSPYGSFNHSHADQNSFVINSKGQPLAIDSGYYDYYNSPHWKNWYKQTRAHNAMTFDGGQGQMHDTLAAKGKVTQFETTPAYDMVTGDATQAYGGALTRAVRSMIYVHPDTLLVFDSLASDTPRTWEWNIHALAPMKAQDEKHIEIEQGGARLCVDVLEAPAVRFGQTDQFSSAPSGSYPGQWHGVFASREKSGTATFITALTLGCGSPRVNVMRQGAGWEARVGEHRFLLGGEGGVSRASDAHE